MIAFVQPFGFNSPGGGPRILRALVSTAHPPILSINTGSTPSPPSATREIHLPLRRTFGRIEHTRFGPYFSILDQLYSAAFRWRLAGVIRENNIQALHLIPHTYDIVPITDLVREINLPLFLNIHDDFRYGLSGHPGMRRVERAVDQAWRMAEQVFVISPEMGDEYARRYGMRAYEVVTDGLTAVAALPREMSAKSLRVYFMGLFHHSYRANFRALLDALKIIRRAHPEWDISAICRCGAVPVAVGPDDVPVTVLPLASEQDVEKDMLAVDFLYQPLPFEAGAANLNRFSLSTKMITYLGSGLPILYHGPHDSAACQLLERNHAAVACKDLSPEQIAKALTESMAKREELAVNALSLARSRFMLADQQERFWGNICGVMKKAS